MAHLISKDAVAKIDNAAGTLTAISGSVNNSALQGLQNALDDTGLGDEEYTFVPGLAGASVPLNGFVNSTTEAIFGPLIGNYTSVTKTFAVKYGGMWFTGESIVENPTITGNVGAIQAWSCNLRVTGAVTRTSVEPT